MTELLVDPAVSRAKFDREVETFREQAIVNAARGLMLVHAKFPDVWLNFSAPHLKPSPVVFGANLDFSNYDLWPASVQIVNPFTRVPLKAKELPVHFLRLTGNPTVGPRGELVMPQPVSVIQWHAPDDVPFMCMAGVREYHKHPAHNGDDWFLHRGRGEGTLPFIAEKLWLYGVRPILGWQVEIRVAERFESVDPSRLSL